MRVHVIGAGVAGMACALRVARAGVPVTLYEAAAQAGGRCRSVENPSLGRIDNGTHLFLGANHGVFDYLSAIGARNGLTALAPARFPFRDLASGAAWNLQPNAGRFPWWILRPERRVAGSRAHHYLAALRLMRARPATTVAEAVGANPLHDRLWRPLCEAVLNTEPEVASARLLGDALAATLLHGEAASRPYVAAVNLTDAFVTPGLAALSVLGADMRFRHPLRGLAMAERVTSLSFPQGAVAIGPRDRVVLAVPWWAARRLLPWLPSLPGRAVVNAHFRLPNGSVAAPRLIAAVGGTSQWMLLRNGLVSVTVSAADALVAENSEALARRIWAETAAVLAIAPAFPSVWKIIKERRATIAHTPALLAARPAATTPIPNLWLAGDWTDTGWPCTVEGAVQSGHAAAKLVAATLP